MQTVQIPDRINESKTTEWAKVIAVVLTAIGLLMNAREGWKNRELQRALFTSNLVARLDNPDITEARFYARDKFPPLRERKSVSSMSPQEAAAFFSSTDVEMIQRQNKVQTVLNYFEDVSAACEVGIANEERVKESLGTLMIRWHVYFEQYINVVTKDWEYSAWGPYNRVVRKWRAEDMKNKQ